MSELTGKDMMRSCVRHCEEQATKQSLVNLAR